MRIEPATIRACKDIGRFTKFEEYHIWPEAVVSIDLAHVARIRYGDQPSETSDFSLVTKQVESLLSMMGKADDEDIEITAEGHMFTIQSKNVTGRKAVGPGGAVKTPRQFPRDCSITVDAKLLSETMRAIDSVTDTFTFLSIRDDMLIIEANRENDVGYNLSDDTIEARLPGTNITAPPTERQPNVYGANYLAPLCRNLFSSGEVTLAWAEDAPLLATNGIHELMLGPIKRFD